VHSMLSVILNQWRVRKNIMCDALVCFVIKAKKCIML